MRTSKRGALAMVIALGVAAAACDSSDHDGSTATDIAATAPPTASDHFAGPARGS